MLAGVRLREFEQPFRFTLNCSIPELFLAAQGFLF